VKIYYSDCLAVSFTAFAPPLLAFSILSICSAMAYGLNFGLSRPRSSWPHLPKSIRAGTHRFAHRTRSSMQIPTFPSLLLSRIWDDKAPEHVLPLSRCRNWTGCNATTSTHTVRQFVPACDENLGLSAPTMRTAVRPCHQSHCPTPSWSPSRLPPRRTVLGHRGHNPPHCSPTAPV